MPKKTFEAAASANAHLIVQIKANQSSLYRRVKAFCADAEPLCHAADICKDRRNRHETRIVTVFAAGDVVSGTQWEPWVAAIIRVERTVLAFLTSSGSWKTTAETSFYLSSRPVSAGSAAKAVREHWSVENSLHHVRDVTFREDASRIRTNPGIFARIRSFAYNLLRLNQSETFAQDRYARALGGIDALVNMRLS